MNPSVKLTAYNLGGYATEADFDAWAQYVAAHIDEACGFEVDVDQFRFVGGPAKDEVRDATDEQGETIREALRELWERGSAESFKVQAPTA